MWITLLVTALLVGIAFVSGGSSKCLNDKDAGTCSGTRRYFYYDKTSRSCISGTFTSCPGNLNYFRYKSVCERTCAPYIGEESAPIETSSSPCPSGWSLYSAEKACLKAYSDQASWKSFAQARQVCQGQGGELVQVRDTAKSNFVGGLLTRQYWMGVEDPARNRVWKYVNGTAVSSYQPWRQGEPSYSGNSEFCVLVVGSTHASKGQWNDGNCADRLPFVCEKSSCPGGYQYYPAENSCIRAFPKTIRKSFDGVRAMCQTEGGDMVTVKDDAKASFIKTIYDSDYWLGVRDPQRVRQWKYLDGTPLGSFKPWNRSEPNNSGNGEYCVLSYAPSKKWNDGYCPDKLGVVCEIV